MLLFPVSVFHYVNVKHMEIVEERLSFKDTPTVGAERFEIAN